MQINSIPAVTSVMDNLSVGSTTPKTGAQSFSDVFNEALNSVIDTDKANTQSTNAVLSGADEGLDTTMIQAEKSELALNLAIQIRNKVIDAYNEIIRMQL